MTTSAVLITTAWMPPPSTPSVTTGRASLTIMLPRISVVRRRCESLLQNNRRQLITSTANADIRLPDDKGAPSTLRPQTDCALLVPSMP